MHISVFFFSSRRRHTRWNCDWSSDVCSSDLALGLTPPLIAELLRSRGIANAQLKRETFTPSRRGGGGDLKMLWWQAPTILNPHLAVGVKDGDGSRLFYEPFVSFDPEGSIVPVLAAEVPTLQNGQVARNGLSVTVKLKKGVQW